MQGAAVTAVHDGAFIGLVDLDGRPRLTMSGAFSDPGVNTLAHQQAEQHFLGSLTAAVGHTRAKFPHAAVLDSLNVAGRAIRAACSHGGTIYLEDSGLEEFGPVNFRLPGMLGARPADVVSFLAREHELPNLRGISLVLVGIGDTSLPQHPLSISQQAKVVAIWSAIAKAGGASVRVDPIPLSGAAPAHVPAVSTVPVPALAVWSPSDPTFVFPDSGPVGFKPNTAAFRDPPAASRALRKIANYLAANSSARIELTGTTAHWGSFSGALTLARQRADTVRSTLVRLGAAPSQIHTRGLGWHFRGYVNDQGPNGGLLPGPAEHNRSVIVTRA
jgi:outer membrane protein OmpA-like peptidoglycan-associated protein